MNYFIPKTTKEKFKFWVVTYPVSLIVGTFFLFLFVIGRLDIRHWERIPSWPKKMILVSNHPSLWEPIMLVAIFVRWFLYHPFQYLPWSAPDKKNYDRNLLYWAIKSRFVYVPRGDKLGEKRAFKKILDILHHNGIFILHPEGGRTSSETNGNFLYSRQGQQIRKFKNGVGHIIKMSDPDLQIVLVWVENTDKVLPRNVNFPPRLWHKVIVKFGKPITFPNEWRTSTALAGKKMPDVITNFLEQKMLELADEAT